MILFIKLFSLILIAYCVGMRFAKDTEQKLRVYYWITMVAFVFYMAFRNPIFVDHQNYINLYDKVYNYVQREGFFVIFTPSFSDSVSEVGFALLNLFVRFIFNDVIYVFIFSALLIVLPLWRFFKRSPYFLFAVYLYLVIGTYFEGFNIMRQMIASSLALGGYPYIRQRNFWKYCLWVLLASSFHTTALAMIPAYFLLCPLPKENLSHIRIRRLVILGMGLIAALLIGPAVRLIVDLVYGGNYGYVDGITPLKWTNIVIPTGCFVFCELLLHLWPKYKERKHPIQETFNINSTDYIILESGTLCWYAVQLCRMQVPLMTRFACFFNPYLLLLITLSIYNCADKRLRRYAALAIFAGLFLMMLWSFRSNPLNDYQTIFFDLFAK